MGASRKQDRATFRTWWLWVLAATLVAAGIEHYLRPALEAKALPTDRAEWIWANVGPEAGWVGFFAVLQSKFSSLIAEINEIQHRINIQEEDFQDWMMNLERASPQNFLMWKELIILFQFRTKADPNKIIDEYYLDDQLPPEHRNTLIQHMVHPLKMKFRVFLQDLSEEFHVSLFQKIHPRM